MKNDVINKIIDVINNNSSLEDKISQLQLYNSHRRGKNKIIISTIIEMLSKHTLPLHFDEPFYIHYLNMLDPLDYKVLSSISSRSTCLFFNALCLEVIGSHCHSIDSANKALETYFALLKSERDYYQQASLVTAICRIISKFKNNKFDIKEFHRFCLDTLIPNIPPHENFVNIILRALLMGCNTQELEFFFKETIDDKVSSCEYDKTIDLTQTLIDVYKKENRILDKQNLLSKLAKYYELAADQLDWDNPKNAHRIIHLILQAMNSWSSSKHSNANEERKRLVKKIEPIKKLFADNIGVISSQEIDLSEIIDQMESLTREASFEMCIWNFTRAVNLVAPNDIEDRHKELNLVFSSLFGTTMLDSNGRIRCIVPAFHNASPEEKKLIWEHEAERDYSIYADAIISRYLHIIKKRFSFTEDNIKFIVDNNAFIPEDRKVSFVKGLVAGFNYDYISALSILMPQVENAIRRLATDCGAVVYITEQDGVEKCLSLESILNRSEMIDCLDPVFLFNLKVFYTSTYGFGMRNIISHGLMSDDELSSCQGLIVWWFTLRICCDYSIELIRRLSMQNKTVALSSPSTAKN